MSGVFFTMQSKLARQIYLALALYEWKAFVENLVKLGYICNMNEINKKKRLANGDFLTSYFLDLSSYLTENTAFIIMASLRGLQI